MNNKKPKIYNIFVYVILGLITVSILVPVIWVFLASFKENSEFYGSPWTLPSGLHWQNFSDAWNKANMGDYMLTSLKVTVMALGILLVVALPAAYILARGDFKGKKILNTLFMSGLFINVSYIVVPIFLMLLDWDKAVKSVFPKGFFLNNTFILALVYASTALPFTIYLLTGYFVTLPKDFEEAAYLDGAGYIKTMVLIMFPLATPSIVTVILFNFLSFWNEYIISMTLLYSMDASRTLPVGIMNLMKAQNAAAQYGQMYAGLVMVMLPTLILYIIVQRKLTEGMTVGGVKG